MNCGKRFHPTRPEQKFCPPPEAGKSSPCRDGFHKHGGSYMKVLDRVKVAIRQETAELRKEIEVLRASVDQLEARIKKRKR